jgi:hypothetical protein
MHHGRFDRSNGRRHQHIRSKSKLMPDCLREPHEKHYGRHYLHGVKLDRVENLRKSRRTILRLHTNLHSRLLEIWAKLAGAWGKPRGLLVRLNYPLGSMGLEYWRARMVVRVRNRLARRTFALFGLMAPAYLGGGRTLTLSLALSAHPSFPTPRTDERLCRVSLTYPERARTSHQLDSVATRRYDTRRFRWSHNARNIKGGDMRKSGFLFVFAAAVVGVVSLARLPIPPLSHT